MDKRQGPRCHSPDQGALGRVSHRRAADATGPPPVHAGLQRRRRSRLSVGIPGVAPGRRSPLHGRLGFLGRVRLRSPRDRTTGRRHAVRPDVLGHQPHQRRSLSLHDPRPLRAGRRRHRRRFPGRLAARVRLASVILRPSVLALGFVRAGLGQVPRNSGPLRELHPSIGGL